MVLFPHFPMKTVYTSVLFLLLATLTRADVPLISGPIPHLKLEIHSINLKERPPIGVAGEAIRRSAR
jgi:hypothetical protein